MSVETLPLKILVVEDDNLVREMLQEILTALGHSVNTAVDGHDALQQLTMDLELGLLISDMNMPEMSGLDLLRILREGGNLTPVIILTGNQEIRVAIEALKIGANDYILKDENLSDTVAISINTVMEMHSLKMENLRLVEDLKRKNRELERLSLLDALTGVANRRYFDNIIQEEWRRSLREQSPIAVVMIDIDYFKTYNDSYGHQQGDVCLQKVAKALSAGLKRPADFFARYGGEEFVGVMPETQLDGALQLSECMRKNVEQLALEHKASKVCGHVTVSMGVASTIPNPESTYDDLLQRADEALYTAKQEGRNRVRTANVASK